MICKAASDVTGGFLLSFVTSRRLLYQKGTAPRRRSFCLFCLVIAVLRLVFCVPGRILRVGRILRIRGILHIGILAGIAVILALTVGIVCIVSHNNCLL